MPIALVTLTGGRTGRRRRGMGKGKVLVLTLAGDGSCSRQQIREQIGEFHENVEADLG